MNVVGSHGELLGNFNEKEKTFPMSQLPRDNIVKGKVSLAGAHG
jgi:hypothetical protein